MKGFGSKDILINSSRESIFQSDSILGAAVVARLAALTLLHSGVRCSTLHCQSVFAVTAASKEKFIGPLLKEKLRSHYYTGAARICRIKKVKKKEKGKKFAVWLHL